MPSAHRHRSPTTSIFFALCLLCVWKQGVSQEYVVQVGVFRYPTDALFAKAESLGTITTQQASGLTKLFVGKYDSLEAANDDLYRIQASGFADAFVRKLDAKTVSDRSAIPQTQQASFQRPSEPSATHKHAHEHAPGTPAHRHLNASDQEKLNALSDEERQQAVYLDGKLHLKQGDQFIPL